MCKLGGQLKLKLNACRMRRVACVAKSHRVFRWHRPDLALNLDLKIIHRLAVCISEGIFDMQVKWQVQ